MTPTNVTTLKTTLYVPSGDESRDRVEGNRV